MSFSWVRKYHQKREVRFESIQEHRLPRSDTTNSIRSLTLDYRHSGLNAPTLLARLQGYTGADAAVSVTLLLDCLVATTERTRPSGRRFQSSCSWGRRVGRFGGQKRPVDRSLLLNLVVLCPRQDTAPVDCIISVRPGLPYVSAVVGPTPADKPQPEPSEAANVCFPFFSRASPTLLPYSFGSVAYMRLSVHSLLTPDAQRQICSLCEMDVRVCVLVACFSHGSPNATFFHIRPRPRRRCIRTMPFRGNIEVSGATYQITADFDVLHRYD
uniref:Uncharacterized protein n=1 Tax=Panagrellus redivivus TaxID=6233 RepID=A0A7E4UN48_PANRE